MTIIRKCSDEQRVYMTVTESRKGVCMDGAVLKKIDICGINIKGVWLEVGECRHVELW